MSKILVLENEINLGELRQALEPRGHQIVAAESIHDAMELLARGDIEMVVCAVHLVFESVFDFLKQVRSNPDKSRSQLPFVFYCAQPGLIAKFLSETNATASVLLGANKYILMDKFDPLRLALEIELCFPCFDVRMVYNSIEASSIEASS